MQVIFSLIMPKLVTPDNKDRCSIGAAKRWILFEFAFDFFYLLDVATIHWYKRHNMQVIFSLIMPKLVTLGLGFSNKGNIEGLAG